jgi:hypothetical protein
MQLSATLPPAGEDALVILGAHVIRHGSSLRLISKASEAINDAFDSDPEKEFSKYAEGGCQLYYVVSEDEQEKITCALRCILASTSIIIDYVHTDKGHRGRGLARLTTTFVINLAHAHQMNCFVVSTEDAASYWMGLSFVLEENPRLCKKYNNFSDTYLLRLPSNSHEAWFQTGDQVEIMLSRLGADSDVKDEDEKLMLAQALPTSEGVQSTPVKTSSGTNVTGADVAPLSPKSAFKKLVGEIHTELVATGLDYNEAAVQAVQRAQLEFTDTALKPVPPPAPAAPAVAAAAAPASSSDKSFKDRVLRVTVLKCHECSAGGSTEFSYDVWIGDPGDATSGSADKDRKSSADKHKKKICSVPQRRLRPIKEDDDDDDDDDNDDDDDDDDDDDEQDEVMVQQAILQSQSDQESESLRRAIEQSLVGTVGTADGLVSPSLVGEKQPPLAPTRQQIDQSAGASVTSATPRPVLQHMSLEGGIEGGESDNESGDLRRAIEQSLMGRSAQVVTESPSCESAAFVRHGSDNSDEDGEEDDEDEEEEGEGEGDEDEDEDEEESEELRRAIEQSLMCATAGAGALGAVASTGSDSTEEQTRWTGNGKQDRTAEEAELAEEAEEEEEEALRLAIAMSLSGTGVDAECKEGSTPKRQRQ